MNTESDVPYPVTAVTDLASDYSAEHFRFAVGRCRDVIAKVIGEDNRSDQQIARVRILKNLDIQLSRAVRWIEEDADLMAGVLRNLIELKFWAHFVSDSPARAAQFISEAEIDARELFDKLESDLPKLYKRVQKHLNLSPENPGINDNLKQTLTGFISIICGLSGL